MIVFTRLQVGSVPQSAVTGVSASEGRGERPPPPPRGCQGDIIMHPLNINGLPITAPPSESEGTDQQTGKE